MRGTTPLTRVLLVDDNADLRLIWRLLLTRDDRFDWVDEAGSGEEALQRLGSSARPDVVVSDVHMGAISGFDVLDVVRRTLPAVPVVLTSSMDGLRAEAIDRGAAAFLAKADTTTENFADSIWAVVRDSVRFRHTQNIQRFPV